MDYDNAANNMGMSFAAREEFYKAYIQPHLKYDPQRSNINLFFQLAENAWRLGVKKNDIKKMLFIEWICEQLASNFEADFIELAAIIMAELHDTLIITENAERNAYNSRLSGATERILGDGIRLYKVFFENEFKLWATTPYFYICKFYQVKNDGTTPDSYVRIGASEKFYALKGIEISLPRGNPKDLVDGFNTDIRNAGEGHDSWEITDKDTILLKITNPKTGKAKGAKKIELKQKELADLTDQCRKTIWSLSTGFNIFLNNNPDFIKKIPAGKLFKLNEIERKVKGFANDYWLDVKNLKIDNGRKNINISLKHDPKTIGENGQIFFGDNTKYDLVKVETEVTYKDQVLGVIQFLLSFFDESNLPKVNVKIFNEKNLCIGNLEYEPNELKKLLLEKKNEPLPSSGKMPTDKYFFSGEIKVPFGQRELYKKMLQSIYKDKKII
jgi:hypothetical protein